MHVKWNSSDVVVGYFGPPLIVIFITHYLITKLYNTG